MYPTQVPAYQFRCREGHTSTVYNVPIANRDVPQLCDVELEDGRCAAPAHREAYPENAGQTLSRDFTWQPGIRLDNGALIPTGKRRRRGG